MLLIKWWHWNFPVFQITKFDTQNFGKNATVTNMYTTERKKPLFSDGAKYGLTDRRWLRKGKLFSLLPRNRPFCILMFICLGVPPRGTLLLYTSAVRSLLLPYCRNRTFSTRPSVFSALHQFLPGTTWLGSGSAPGLNQAKARLDQYQSSLFSNSGSVYIWCGSSSSKNVRKNA